MEKIATWFDAIRPLLIILGAGFLTIIMTAAFSYWFFILRKRRKWLIHIYEQSSDGRMHKVAKDWLLEKRARKGTVTYYWLKNARQEAPPPPNDCSDLINGRWEADFLRVRRAYMPLKKSVKTEYKNPNSKESKLMVTNHDTMLSAMKKPKFSTNLFSTKNKEVEQRFIYAPMNKIPHVNVAYHQMAYDMDMMRINDIDNTDKMFADAKSFWEKWGALMTVGILIVAIIVIAYMGFEYAHNVSVEVTNSASAQLGKVTEQQQSIIDKLTTIVSENPSPPDNPPPQG